MYAYYFTCISLYTDVYTGPEPRCTVHVVVFGVLFRKIFFKVHQPFSTADLKRSKPVKTENKMKKNPSTFILLWFHNAKVHKSVKCETPAILYSSIPNVIVILLAYKLIEFLLIEQTCRIILCTTSINSNHIRIIGTADGWCEVQSLFIYSL